VRYRGLTKNLAQAETMFALANLFVFDRARCGGDRRIDDGSGARQKAARFEQATDRRRTPRWSDPAASSR
jgi:hypothetical protein